MHTFTHERLPTVKADKCTKKGDKQVGAYQTTMCVKLDRHSPGLMFTTSRVLTRAMAIWVGSSSTPPLPAQCAWSQRLQAVGPPTWRG